MTSSGGSATALRVAGAVRASKASSRAVVCWSSFRPPCGSTNGKAGRTGSSQERQVAGGARQRRQQRYLGFGEHMDLVVGRVDGADGLDEQARHLGLRGHDCHLGSRALTQVIHGATVGRGRAWADLCSEGTSCTCSLDPYASPAVTPQIRWHGQSAMVERVNAGTELEVALFQLLARSRNRTATFVNDLEALQTANDTLTGDADYLAAVDRSGVHRRHWRRRRRDPARARRAGPDAT